MSTEHHAQPVQEDLSRMEGEYGAKMIGKLKKMDVLLVGLKGLGIETAKNLILAGPHSVVVHDDEITTIADLGANFYLHESDVGKPRGAAVLAKLVDLNPNCRVKLHTGTITDSDLTQFHVVCVCDTYPLEQLTHWNKVCRSHQPHAVAFILAATDGAQGYLFSDFGDAHACSDVDGTPLKNIVIDNITNDKHGVITVDSERGHMLSDGDLIRLEEVRGMSSGSDHKSHHHDHDDDSVSHYFKHDDVITEINTVLEVKTTKNPKKFTIGDTTKLNAYAGGGLGVQVKKPTVFKFAPLADQITNPSFCQGYMDFSKFGRDAHLHVARVALWRFMEKHNGAKPKLHNEDDAKEVVELAHQFAKELKDSNSPFQAEVDIDIVRKVALFSTTELSPFAALFGGIVAQEITKQAGKYSPVQQWIYYDAFELLDDAKLVPADATPVNSRYDHQIAIFGKAFQDKVEAQRLFLVGCGALGCEYLKSFANTGLGTKAAIHATDDDRIELSNLNRQFLFRRVHVQKPKSRSAAETVTQMNAALKDSLQAHEIRVEPKTEDVFDDPFWEKLDFVINALDNMHARKYVDSKCVLYKKPLFESGTLGTQANTVVCLPHKTPSYSEGAVAGEDQGIAKCTLRNFPSDIVHCIEWGREKFDDLFVSAADNVNSFLEDRTGFIQKLAQDPPNQLEGLRSVSKWLEYSKSPSLETCVKVAFDEFIGAYRNSILDLTHAFPQNARVIERSTGVDLGAFWHGHKRFPTAAQLNLDDELHLDYLYHGASIFANVLNLASPTREQVRAIAAKINVPEWKYSGSVDMSGDEKKNEDHTTSSSATVEAAPKEDEKDEVERLTAELNALDVTKYAKLNVNDFEKDDDSNHHVDWITASSNLRARNYDLKAATRAKCRMTAGRIIPALATTTATITGFVMIEVFKYIRYGIPENVDKYRAATINLGTNTFVLENLPDPIYKKSGRDLQTHMDIVAIPEKHTIWDLVVIDKPGLTLQEFIDEFSAVHHGCTIDMVSTTSGSVLYNSLDLYDKKKKEAVAEKLKTPVIDLYTRIVGPMFPANRNYIIFDCTVEDESGNTGIVPLIKYIFKH